MATASIETWTTAGGLVAALAVGLLIGVERGWRDRDLAEGGRVAGLRTFALVGLLGGVLGSLTADLGAWILPGGFVGLSLLLAVSYREAARKTGNLSVTTAVATLLSFMLGVLAARGAPAMALAAAVVTAVLLNLKPTLHAWLQRIESRELSAALQLLVLSVVILPNLPDVGYGPYQALNPYRLWWAVVLIAGLSLAGHFAMRLTGAQRGIFLTGLLGGLASSTAATLALARHARRQPALADAAAAGALAACGVMFLRMAVLVAFIQPSLLHRLGVPMSVTGSVLILLASWHWRRRLTPAGSAEEVESVATFDLGTALAFGGFLAAMAVLVPAARQWLGDAGIYALAAVSGLADVDATVISMSRAQANGALSVGTTVVAIGLTTLVNMGTKAGIAWTTSGAAVGRPVLRGYAIGMGIGALAAFAVMFL
jgi:uncharacterized membrane protein (DUF4010 family)